tara:strand:+ start:7656 stop:8699 length:1044 start_codon:yes stop_codon:yes gene_type:complete
LFKHQNFKLSNRGVENYFWPINRAEVANLYREMIQDSASFFKNSNTKEDSEFFEHLKIINMYLVLKIADLYQKKILEFSIKGEQSKNFDGDIFDLELDQSKNKYLDYLKGIHWPEPSKFRIHRKLRNLLVTKIRNDGLSRQDLYDINLGNEIILTGINPLASRYARKANNPVTLVKIIDFFTGANSDDIQENLKRSESEYFNYRIFSNYLEVFTTILNNYGVELSAADLSEIHNWHKDFSLCVSYYQNLLKKHTSNLPKSLWTSSAGILWNKILAIEVRKQGGLVTGFDHAEGATLSTETIFPFIEFQEVDVFVTHSKTFKSYLLEASADQLYTFNCPDVISIDENK